MSRPAAPVALRTLTGLVLVCALTATVGCARGGSAPTQAEYVAAADDLCEATDERLEELQRDRDVARVEAAAEGDDTLDQRPDRWVRARVVPEYKTLDRNLRSLPAPEGDRAYLADLYADLSRQIDVLHLSPGKGRDVIREDVDLRKRFATYGMKVCGRI